MQRILSALSFDPENEILTVWVSIIWVFYNLIILGGAVAVSVEQAGAAIAPRGDVDANGDCPR